MVIFHHYPYYHIDKTISAMVVITYRQSVSIILILVVWNFDKSRIRLQLF